MLRALIALVLVLTLTSCGGDQAVSQEPFFSHKENTQISAKQITEVSPPVVIQALQPTLEVYQPQVTIVTPHTEEVLQDNTVTVRLLVKDLPIFKDPELGIGPHLQVILDNEPYITVYDLNQPLILPDLSPGTHTLRVFATRPWNESFKNEGAYAQTTFHIFTKTDDNNPDAAVPLITYNSPQGSYGAEPILLDFYLTNAPLHLVAQENAQDQIADWRIRCTINGESFVLDRWQSVYLKGFKPGKNWVKLEFLDEQGNPVKNVFNSTVKLITYEPKGKDTLSRIVRGEISLNQAKAIAYPNYTTPTVEPTPATPNVAPTPETQPIEPTPTPTPTVEPTPETEIQTPQPEVKIPETAPQPEVTKEPESKPIPEVKGEKRRWRGFFNRRVGKMQSKQPTVEPTPIETPTQSTVEPTPIETPTQSTVEPTPIETPTQPTVEPTPIETPTQPTVEPTPNLPPTLPEIIESPPSEAIPEP
ncbi:hypothetical protein [Iningainema tapete]|uniref:FHA domain containing protein n=1 Tax=Iningainema tapete BLCC-T55 TaxID=2748662 RepID=A0A8J7BYV7_9CYAN|nr:hypothetical protein [Iningainema tapete]MBD2774708.1 hypothetical protein [Iningainema tapete BLCC-T55]